MPNETNSLASASILVLEESDDKTIFTANLFFRPSVETVP